MLQVYSYNQSVMSSPQTMATNTVPLYFRYANTACIVLGGFSIIQLIVIIFGTCIYIKEFKIKKFVVLEVDDKNDSKGIRNKISNISKKISLFIHKIQWIHVIRLVVTSLVVILNIAIIVLVVLELFTLKNLTAALVQGILGSFIGMIIIYCFVYPNMLEVAMGNWHFTSYILLVLYLIITCGMIILVGGVLYFYLGLALCFLILPLCLFNKVGDLYPMITFIILMALSIFFLAAMICAANFFGPDDVVVFSIIWV